MPAGPTQPLVDSFARTHRDLRISITDRCNFRCTYCMPAEGMPWLPRADVLTFEEIERLARIFVERFGFDSIRLTGGEPTVRAHLPVLVRKLAALGADLALTTNGATLDMMAHDLAEAGLGRVNISLDSLQAERFAAITKRDALDQVLGGIHAAVAAGLAPVKLNVVAMRGVNDDEIVTFARFGREHGVEIRFIEFMPLDAQGEWRADLVLTQAEILARIHAELPLVLPDASTAMHADPAERFAFVDGNGWIGVIASVTQPFCASCDRVRLTAEGRLRNCLFAHDETDLRGPMRAGATDDDLMDLIAGNVAGKWAGHQIGQAVFVQPRRGMSQIGG